MQNTISFYSLLIFCHKGVLATVLWTAYSEGVALVCNPNIVFLHLRREESKFYTQELAKMEIISESVM